MRILVTGHNGYLGSVMVPLLQAAGHEVVGLDTFLFADCTLGHDSVPIRALQKDIRDLRPDDLEGLAAVIHLAALCDDPLGELGSEIIDEVNHRAAVHVARCAHEAGVSRFLFASSCAVYGGVRDEVLTEDAARQPETPYAIAKVRAEDEIARLADGRFSPVFMRAPTCYGVSPRMRVDTLLNNLVCWAHLTGRLRLGGDGARWRPVVHVQDVAHAFAAALTTPRHVVHGQAFNVGAAGENYQLAEFADVVSGAVPGCRVEHVSGDHADQRSYRVDFGKLARTCPDFKPQWNASFGAKDLYATLQETRLTFEEFRSRKYLRLDQLQHLRVTGAVDARFRTVAARESEVALGDHGPTTNGDRP